MATTRGKRRWWNGGGNHKSSSLSFFFFFLLFLSFFFFSWSRIGAPACGQFSFLSFHIMFDSDLFYLASPFGLFSALDLCNGTTKFLPQSFCPLFIAPKSSSPQKVKKRKEKEKKPMEGALSVLLLIQSLNQFHLEHTATNTKILFNSRERQWRGTSLRPYNSNFFWFIFFRPRIAGPVSI